MCRIVCICILVFSSVQIFGIEITSLKRQLDTLSIEDQLKEITGLEYEFIVTNNQALIPIFKNYIATLNQFNKPEILAILYERLSLMYYFNGKYDKNFEYGLKAVHLYDSLGYRVKLGNMYGELGYQMKRRDLLKAFKLMQKGKAILEKENNAEMLAKFYDNYGVLYEMRNCLDTAFLFYKKALKIKLQLNDSIGIPYTLCNLFMVNSFYGKMDSALHYLDEAARIRKITNDQVGLTECYSYYGDYFVDIGDLEKGLKYFQKTLDNAIKFNYTNLASQMYEKLALVSEKNNNLQRALYYYKLFKQYQDSLLNAETNKTIANLQIKYETAEKEKEIERKSLELKTKSQQIIILFILFALAIVLFVLIYSRYRQKQKLYLHEKLNEEKSLRFIEVIETEEKERTRIARELHDGLGQLLSSAKMNMASLDESIPEPDKFLFENALKLMDQSVSEVRTISHNLMPVSLMRYGLKATINEMVQRINDTQKIKVEANFDNFEGRLPNNDERNIYRLIQEIVNNIMKHAEADFIFIKMALLADNKVSITIENNGILFDLGMLKDAKGIGWKNIYARVNILKGDVEIKPGKESGTQILVTLQVNG